MHTLTNKQLIHREYLKSPLWLRKREEAMAHYGPICNRCGRHGTDVHHKTYDRVGGAEILTDLEILCRECHEAHHRVERVSPKRSRNKGISRPALARYLTEVQREILQRRFVMSWPELYCAIVDGRNEQVAAALEMVGKKYAYAPRTNPNKRAWKSQKHHARLMG